jgi:hypothetical protein
VTGDVTSVHEYFGGYRRVDLIVITTASVGTLRCEELLSVSERLLESSAIY